MLYYERYTANGETEEGDDLEAEDEPEVEKAYLPGDAIEDDEALEVDLSAYDMLHSVNVEWPCLSFDIIPDGLGDNRTKFPMTTYLVGGTQAEKAHQNKIIFMKLSQMHKTKFDNDSDASDDDDDDALDEDAILTSHHIKHNGGINRVRASPTMPGVVAVWSETGKVSMYDGSAHISALDTPPTVPLAAKTDPIFTFNGHPTEGYSMDWSPTVPGRFVSGDCHKHIYLWEPTQEGSWNVNKTPFKGHTESVEDIQWSPSEPNVMASASCDKTVRIWDTRKKNGSALTVQAHDVDVNVLSWNKLTNYLMVSGGDDGQFKVWDLRTFSSGGANVQPVASFKWHSAPITSVEWHPTDDSVLAVSGADDQTTLWDLSVENDKEEAGQSDAPDVPPQLLFIHQGQQDVKEHHWHPQCPSVLISTAASGINVFKTISV
ncbi:hypothetical protein SARC_02002 [Sphaeroforma arctica JP610]|uniref:Glutamate-rich WD repeat-containing protein 1 n=1 Tax=Sphaeroforma arctica JP610 TaxID=667725 RepID=A0A0L0GC33_9EUKA|nr:hypothetical protein SARC_02002 [Sphaeroforma arctica JP610]KNC85818.1 hypothetical protein SARC_02002 [Sphaeroforma arctica JP610]|eukprot:XP_014159720.1 hypothetical protein SARC_02002 [Sphaeroforma arctica JP610]